MSTLEFKPLTFKEVDDNSMIRPPIDLSCECVWIRGELVSLHQAKNALLLTMNFYPTALDSGAREAGRLNELGGWATFLIVKKGSNYFGRIVESEHITMSRWYGPDNRKSEHIGSTKPYPSFPGRGKAEFMLDGWGGNVEGEISVSVYLRTRLFGDWKEIIIEEPDGMRWIARP